MSYSIIFETKIIKLKDGRLLHLDLSGCNNDTSGRDRGDFIGKIYSKEDFIKRAESYKQNSKPSKESDEWDMKIGSKFCTMYDYGEHLLRMMKRAETWEELNCFGRYVNVQRLDGVNVWEDGKQIKMTLKEFDDYALKNMYTGKFIKYMILRTDLETEEDIIKALDNNEMVKFYIGKKTRTKAS